MKYTRKHFLYQSAVLLAMAATGGALRNRMAQPLLSFSTIGCPDWPFETIVQFAQQHGYHGVEIRNLQRELDLPNHPLFNTKENIANTMKVLQEHGLQLCDLGTSSQLHHAGANERKKNLDDAKRFIDLAAQLGCPYIRVFPNDFPPGQERSATIDLIADGLLELGSYANGTNVSVLLESHGQVVHSSDLLLIMQKAKHNHVGLVWDIVNMWAATKEPPAQAYKLLQPYIRHTHIKDLNLISGKEQYTLLGKGEAPVFEGIDALAKGGYTGFYSFEWEKLWHPEIEAPEVALAHYPAAMKAHFAGRNKG